MSQFTEKQLASFYELSSILEGIQRRVWMEDGHTKEPAGRDGSLTIEQYESTSTK